MEKQFSEYYSVRMWLWTIFLPSLFYVLSFPGVRFFEGGISFPEFLAGSLFVFFVSFFSAFILSLPVYIIVSFIFSWMADTGRNSAQIRLIVLLVSTCFMLLIFGALEMWIGLDTKQVMLLILPYAFSLILCAFLVR